ncbi:hypothetical protein PTI98_012584 [Pleurotus ostreatus]|nr:hypothetical protein PTI98_012584 [Pleurotus ostreatus]
MLHLAEEVVQSLSELQSFCADYTADLEVSRDLKKAVKQLESQLNQVLERCRECCDPPQRNRGYFSKPKAYFKMWQKSGKIEEDIEHIRDAIRSSISRLTLLTSARIEILARRLESRTARTEQFLASQMMQSLQLHQFDALFGSMMINTNACRPMIPVGA